MRSLRLQNCWLVERDNPLPNIYLHCSLDLQPNLLSIDFQITSLHKRLGVPARRKALLRGDVHVQKYRSDEMAVGWT